MYQWFDTDADVRIDKERMLNIKPFHEAAFDEVIAKRKQQRGAEGIELFDDWLLNRYQEASEKKSTVLVDFVYEGAVALSEVELHVEPGVSKAPPAHECLRAIELDSDDESADERHFDDGTGDFVDYVGRRVRDNLRPANVHGIDPRTLGQPVEKARLAELRSLAKPLPKDSEEVE